MKVEDWLSDTTIEPPCGPNLEYDDSFMALVSAASGKPEQQYGNTIIPAVDPDWESIVDQATELLGRSKDLRAVVLLARGLTRVRGLAGLAQGLELSRRLLEEHWDAVHPRLEYDSEVDPYFRSNALAALADGDGLVRDLRAATLFGTPAGAVTVRAAEATLRREATDPDAMAMSEAQLKQAAQAGIKVEGAPIVSIGVALDHCNAIAVLTTERMGAEDAPDLTALKSVLQTVQRLVPAPGVEGEGAETAGNAPSAGGPVAEGAASGLRNRQDAVRLLDSVCQYLERNEPSNPAPLFIRRAQRLIGSGFMDIMRDMAPESLGQIELITGQRSSAPPQKDEGSQ